MTNKNEAVSYGIRNIVFTKFKLDKSYSRGKNIVQTDVRWSLGLNWKIDTAGTEWDKVYIYTMLDLYRNKDNFNIATLHATTLNEVSKDISFGMKYNLMVDLCNSASAQIQGAWRVKIYNPFIARILPQAYNKILEMETDLKKMIYEDWE